MGYCRCIGRFRSSDCCEESHPLQLSKYNCPATGIGRDKLITHMYALSTIQQRGGIAADTGPGNCRWLRGSAGLGLSEDSTVLEVEMDGLHWSCKFGQVLAPGLLPGYAGLITAQTRPCRCDIWDRKYPGGLGEAAGNSRNVAQCGAVPGPLQPVGDSEGWNSGRVGSTRGYLGPGETLVCNRLY